jgi:hypothetical protein
MRILRSGVLSAAAALAIGAIASGLPTAQEAKANAIFCNDLWMPVCAVNSVGFRRTYTNACWAHASGARILHKGVCDGPICSMMVKYVCAIDPVTNKAKTYTNECWAEIANATVVANHACPVKP